MVANQLPHTWNIPERRNHHARNLSATKINDRYEEVMKEEMYKNLAQAIIYGEPEKAVALASDALEQGLDSLECITQGLTKGIRRVGELFASGEYFLPSLIIGANAMKAALEVLEPALVDNQQREVAGRVVIGTVRGDLHEIGKNLVGAMLAANGFKVIDIGVDKSSADFLKAIKQHDATIVASSALLTTTMLQQQKLIESIEEAGLRKRVKVMVGGAPVTQTHAEQIGADGYAENAISAVDLALRLADAPG